MSYILEALKKAERERALGQVPDVKSLQQIAAGTEKRRRGRWLLLSAVLAINAGVLIGTLVIPHYHENSTTVAVGPKDETPPMQPTTLSEPLNKPDRIPEPQSSSEPALDRAATASSIETAVPVSRTVAGIGEGKPLSLAELPETVRRSLPELNLDVHVFSELPERRFVLINALRYAEGERLREGPLVDAITAKGVVLNYRDRRFLLPVQR